jgi:hypothetical protein
MLMPIAGKKPVKEAASNKPAARSHRKMGLISRETSGDAGRSLFRRPRQIVADGKS